MRSKINVITIYVNIYGDIVHLLDTSTYVRKRKREHRKICVKLK